MQITGNDLMYASSALNQHDQQNFNKMPGLQFDCARPRWQALTMLTVFICGFTSKSSIYFSNQMNIRCSLLMLSTHHWEPLSMIKHCTLSLFCYSRLWIPVVKMTYFICWKKTVYWLVSVFSVCAYLYGAWVCRRTPVVSALASVCMSW